MPKWNDTIGDPTDAIKTAESMFGIVSYPTTYHVTTPAGFDLLEAKNHRARRGITLDDHFPPDNRPRGDRDISAVHYFARADTSADPVAVLLYKGNLYVIDGVHRLIAAYVTESPIRYCVFYHNMCQE